MLDAVAGLGCLDNLEPVAVGIAGRIGNNLYGIAVLEHAPQGDKPAIDLGAGTVLAHLGMHVEGKVQGRCPFRQLLDIACRRIHVDLVLEEVHLEGMHELLGVSFLPLALKNFVEPGELGQVLAVDAPVLLVEPVCGDAVLGLPVHFLGADLDFDALAVRPYNGGVQALVAVGLGHGNIVLEPAMHRLPLLVHKAQGCVAVLELLDYDAEGHDVVHFVQGQGLGLHLLVDAVLVLDAPVDLALYAGTGKEFLEHGHHFFNDALFHHLVGIKPVVNQVVDIGAQVLEAHVLKTAHDDIEAQAVGQGRIDVHGFLGYALLLVGLLEIQGGHVVQAVGQLHHDDAHVVAHGQDHLADVLGLGLFLVVKGDAADLGHAVHDVGTLVAKVFGNVVDGNRGVLNSVVQKAGCYGGLVKSHAGKRVGDSQRMGKIGLAGQAHLAGMGCSRKDIGLLDKFQVGVLVGGHNLVENFLYTNHMESPAQRGILV